MCALHFHAVIVSNLLQLRSMSMAYSKWYVPPTMCVHRWAGTVLQA